MADCEFVGKGSADPQSAQAYLQSKLVALGAGFKAFHYISGTEDAAKECARVEKLLQEHPVDIAFIAVGPNVSRVLFLDLLSLF